MHVETIGDGDPKLAVVGAVHGDEPSGAAAVERLLADPPELRRPVKLVVANERALDRGVRSVDEDLNRAFPGDPDADTHEGRLAAALTDELAETTTLALHATRSHPEPFAVVDGVDEFARAVVPRLSVVAAVDAADRVEGRLFVADGVLEVETGRQGTPEAADNAERLDREFLAATGALPDPRDPRRVPVYELGEPIPKAARADDDEGTTNDVPEDDEGTTNDVPE
ncbi:MAG: succinylglutamate desuccinylase/aspartoacylase family protein, partial [Halobacteriales archaeon]